MWLSLPVYKGSVPEIVQYGPYYLPLNVFTDSQGSNIYILSYKTFDIAGNYLLDHSVDLINRPDAAVSC